ncbi:MAG: AAA family ATPase, partial [Promethearchaeota archaeon]
MEKSPLIISLSSVRGGPGKSTLGILMAYHLIKQNKKVLLVDFDISGPFLDLIFNVRPIYTLT